MNNLLNEKIKISILAANLNGALRISGGMSQAELDERTQKLVDELTEAITEEQFMKDRAFEALNIN